MTQIQETVHMLDKTVQSTWDLLPKEQLKIVLDGYVEMLKEDSGLNNVSDEEVH